MFAASLPGISDFLLTACVAEDGEDPAAEDAASSRLQLALSDVEIRLGDNRSQLLEHVLGDFVPIEALQCLDELSLRSHHPLDGSPVGWPDQQDSHGFHDLLQQVGRADEAFDLGAMLLG